MIFKNKVAMSLVLSLCAAMAMGVGCGGGDEPAGDGDGDGDGDAVSLGTCAGLCAAADEAGCNDDSETTCAEDCAFLTATCADPLDEYLACAAEEAEVSCVPGVGLGIVEACALEASALRACVPAGDGGAGGGGGAEN